MWSMCKYYEKYGRQMRWLINIDIDKGNIINEYEIIIYEINIYDEWKE